MIWRMEELAIEENVPFAHAPTDCILNDDDLRRAAAYSAYGSWLIKRMDGETDGPSLLALWREIARTPQGSPIRGFSLTYDDFVLAEIGLVEFLFRNSIEGRPT